MFDRIFKNPISTLCGLGIGVLQYIAVSPNGFTWGGLKVVAPTIIMGALFGDGKKTE